MHFVARELYHIYNRGNNRNRIFFKEDNYTFFLNKIRKDLLAYCDVLAYCLMPNHYHLLVHVKEYQFDKPMDPLARKIGTLQSSYTQAINKQENRTGSLFQQKAKSKNVNDYALTCFHYIHQNPMRAKIVSNLDNWKYSSFNSYVGSGGADFINKHLAFQLLEVPKEVELFRMESNGMVDIDHLRYIL
ncbi:MAG: transposase [Cytophagales bacterium]